MDCAHFKKIVNRYSQIMLDIELSCLSKKEKELQTKSMLNQYAVEIIALNNKWAIIDKNKAVYKRFSTKHEALSFLRFCPDSFTVLQL